MTRSSQRHKLEVHGHNARGERPPWLSLMPVIVSLDPPTVPANTSFVLIVLGGGFKSGDVISIVGLGDQVTHFASISELNTQGLILVPTAGAWPVVVKRGAVQSNSVTLTVT